MNLINLVPVAILDGGRMVKAFSPWLSVVGLCFAATIAFYQPSFILIFIIVFSIPNLILMFFEKTEEERRYFEIPSSQRIIAGLVYFGLIIILFVGFQICESRIEGKVDNEQIAAPEYSDKFVDDAVRLVIDDGLSLQDAADKVGAPKPLVKKWALDRILEKLNKLRREAAELTKAITQQTKQIREGAPVNQEQFDRQLEEVDKIKADVERFRRMQSELD